MASNVIFLPIILLIGFITSYEDIKESKIKNKWVILGLLYSFFAYALIWIFCKPSLTNPGLTWNFDKWCINLLISGLVAYVLWHFRMWGAGDAKLFVCYVALIPIGQYSKVYFNYYFAAFLLLSAIFIPPTIFLIVKSGVYFANTFNFSKPGDKIYGFIKGKLAKFNIVKAGDILLGFFFFFLLFKVINVSLYNLFGSRIPGDQNILIVISLFVFTPLSRFFNKNIKMISLALLILMGYVFLKMDYPWERFVLDIKSILGKTLLVILLAPLFQRIVDLHADRIVKKNLPFATWMFLGALITWFL
ncbi:MAG: prepilin peptidase [Candidatus Omnitrophica bacterium]|nr:prepilin peptidase [Candidatus Omnitrophota bacterium]